MALLKALQKLEELPEHQEYMQAMFVYKEACRRYARVPKEFETSSNPLERLQFGDEQRRYKTASKTFHTVRRKWILAKAQQQVGKTVTPDQVAEILQLNIPSSFDELIKDAKRNAIVASTPAEDFEVIKKQLEENATKQAIERGTIKQQFLNSGNINPLRDDDDKEDDSDLYSDTL